MAQGRPTFGYVLSVASPQIARLLAGTGVDWLMIDLEHAPIGVETMAAMIGATTGLPVTPIVRVPAVGSDLVKPALDNGALGIVFPQVATHEEAKQAAVATHYSPKGYRGFGPTYAALRWGLSPGDYIKAADDQMLTIVLIESPAGVAELDEILTVEGIDVVVIARGDLSESLGLAGQFDHPGVKKIVAEAEAKILGAKRAALGGIAFSSAEAKEMAARGYLFVALASDAALIQRAASAQMKEIRG